MGGIPAFSLCLSVGCRWNTACHSCCLNEEVLSSFSSSSLCLSLIHTASVFLSFNGALAWGAKPAPSGATHIQRAHTLIMHYRDSCMPLHMVRYTHTEREKQGKPQPPKLCPSLRDDESGW